MWFQQGCIFLSSWAVVVQSYHMRIKIFQVRVWRLMQIKINGKYIEAGHGKTILEVALKNGIDIPNLCYDPDLEPNGSCRMCVCEVNGRIMTACNTGQKVQFCEILPKNWISRAATGIPITKSSNRYWRISANRKNTYLLFWMKFIIYHPRIF